MAWLFIRDDLKGFEGMRVGIMDDLRGAICVDGNEVQCPISPFYIESDSNRHRFQLDFKGELSICQKRFAEIKVQLEALLHEDIQSVLSVIDNKLALDLLSLLDDAYDTSQFYSWSTGKIGGSRCTLPVLNDSAYVYSDDIVFSLNGKMFSDPMGDPAVSEHCGVDISYFEHGVGGSVMPDKLNSRIVSSLCFETRGKLVPSPFYYLPCDVVVCDDLLLSDDESRDDDEKHSCPYIYVRGDDKDAIYVNRNSDWNEIAAFIHGVIDKAYVSLESVRNELCGLMNKSSQFVDLRSLDEWLKANDEINHEQVLSVTIDFSGELPEERVVRVQTNGKEFLFQANQMEVV